MKYLYLISEQFNDFSEAKKPRAIVFKVKYGSSVKHVTKTQNIKLAGCHIK